MIQEPSMILRAALLLLLVSSFTGFSADMRRPLAVKYSASIEELIVRESIAAGLPPDLGLSLAWEESRFDRWAVRHERNGSWSMGVFQINQAAPRFDLDVPRQIKEGVGRAAHWWFKTHDRQLTKRAYRRGHL